MPLDYNYEIITHLGKLLSKIAKSSKFLEFIEDNYPFSDKTYRDALKLIDKEFKNILFEHEKEYEKLIVEEFLSLLKSIIPDKEIDEITYSLSKEFSEFYEKGNIEGFLKKLKKTQKKLKNLIKKDDSKDKKSFFESILKKEEKNVDRKYKDELMQLLNREEILENSKKELIEIIELFLDNLKSFLETDELLKQKVKNLKEELKQLETIDNIKRFKSDVKDLFIKLGIIERVLEEEKKELKNIILLLAENLKNFIGNSDEYAQALDDFVKKIQETDDVSEIKKLKIAIVKTTVVIKEKTIEINKKLKTADEMLKKAQEKMKKLEEEMEKAKQKALYDGLTGIYNRAVFNDRIVKEVEKAKREKKPLSFLIMDIDHFKKINDTYGHQTGDMVLKILATQVKKVMRDFDFLARYGGEEFVVILPDTELEKAKEIAERIRTKIEKTKFIYKSERIPVTLSIGVTLLKPDDNEKSLIERADKALYEAKNSGRNRVVAK